MLHLLPPDLLARILDMGVPSPSKVALECCCRTLRHVMTHAEVRMMLESAWPLQSYVVLYHQLLIIPQLSSPTLQGVYGQLHVSAPCCQQLPHDEADAAADEVSRWIVLRAKGVTHIIHLLCGGYKRALHGLQALHLSTRRHMSAHCAMGQADSAGTQWALCVAGVKQLHLRIHLAHTRYQTPTYVSRTGVRLLSRCLPDAAEHCAAAGMQLFLEVHIWAEPMSLADSTFETFASAALRLVGILRSLKLYCGKTVRVPLQVSGCCLPS